MASTRQSIPSNASVLVTVSQNRIAGATSHTLRAVQGEESVELTEERVGSRVFTGVLRTFRFVCPLFAMHMPWMHAHAVYKQSEISLVKT